MKSTLIFLFHFILGFSTWAHAQEDREPAAAKTAVMAALPSIPDEEVKKRARYREYPGGRDEEPLKLAPQLNTPVRSYNQTTDAPEPVVEDSHD